MNGKQWKVAAGILLLSPILAAPLAASAQSSAPDPGQQSTQQPATPGTMPDRPAGQWRGEHGPERELRMLTNQLNLTTEQQAGVKAVLQQQQTQMQALRNKPQGDASNADTPDARQARMTQIEQIRDESDTKISALLDENQKKTFADWIQKRKAGMMRRQQQPGTPPPPSGVSTPAPAPSADITQS